MTSNALLANSTYLPLPGRSFIPAMSGDMNSPSLRLLSSILCVVYMLLRLRQSSRSLQAVLTDYQLFSVSSEIWPLSET